MIRKIYINKKYQDGLGSFYIYCTIYDSLVFLYKRSCNSGIADKHLSACIKKKKLNLLDSFLLKIAKKEYEILIYIDNISQAEAAIKHLYLKITFQLLFHSEKDKQISITHDYHRNNTDDII